MKGKIAKKGEIGEKDNEQARAVQSRIESWTQENLFKILTKESLDGCDKSKCEL